MEPSASPLTSELTREPLRWRDLLPVLVFVVLGVILVFGIIVLIARNDRAFYRENLATISLLAALGVYLAAGAGIALGLRRIPAPLRYLRVRRPTLIDLGLTALLLIPWYVGIVLVTALSSIVLNGGRQVQGNSQLLFVQRPNGIGLLLLALLVTSVAAPIVEELFFRGMLLRLLSQRTYLWLALLLSALAFGLAHASPAVSGALLPTFVFMGLVLALVYVRTGWLSNSMLLHGLNNALVTIVAFNLAR